MQAMLNELRSEFETQIIHEPPPSFESSTSAPVSARSTWQNLLDGRLRIASWYDRDGQRFLVARRAAGATRAALTPRQRRFLALRARGVALKVIAYDAGVSMGIVSRELSLAMAQLGLESNADLAAVFGHVAR
jgi:DNA-binding NarL/FixJ family response regulator